MENFNSGTDVSPKGLRALVKAQKLVRDISNKDTQEKIIKAYRANANDEIEVLNNLIASMSNDEKALWKKIAHAYNVYKQEYENYMRNSGEVEARNAQTRADWDEKKRRSILPTATEDISRSEQLISSDYSPTPYSYSSASSSFITPQQLERYEQLMYHGTGNILLGNRFNLKYIGTGEGSQVWGYGAYLAQVLDTSEG